MKTPKTWFLCASCAKTYAEPMHLSPLPEHKAEKNKCLFCGRTCYGDRFIQTKEAQHG